MRRYQLTVNNNQYDIDVEENSATDFTVSIDGQTVNVSLNSQADLADAAITPQIEARSAAIAAAAQSGVPVAPKVPATMRAAKPRTPSPAVAGGADLAYSMSAPMPGVIVEINVAAGATVNKGDVVMVLEAMKMKNDLHASRDGVVESVDVAQTDQVKYGQVLLRFAKD
ncbi:biotin/lipoyl-containing protein [Brooklawnia sp.]|uniref:biotin/lipoyl-containing protein n=1 Tax=Brooklawnia sp. TaxID=2699740 RepID=UPI0031203E0D